MDSSTESGARRGMRRSGECNPHRSGNARRGRDPQLHGGSASRLESRSYRCDRMSALRGGASGSPRTCRCSHANPAEMAKITGATKDGGADLRGAMAVAEDLNAVVALKGPDIHRHAVREVFRYSEGDVGLRHPARATYSRDSVGCWRGERRSIRRRCGPSTCRRRWNRLSDEWPIGFLAELSDEVPALMTLCLRADIETPQIPLPAVRSSARTPDL